MKWKSVGNHPKVSGWYVVALNPSTHSKSEPWTSNEWRKMYGFSKVWFNPDAVEKWWELDSHGYGSIAVDDRVTHWDFIPEVPLL